MSTLTIALIGDHDPSIAAHRAIPIALQLAATAGRLRVRPAWIPTVDLTPETVSTILDRVSGVWCVPGSPYANTAGALSAIRHARLTRIPFLGTCGGFQHLMLEYADSAWGVVGAAHAETDPDAADPVIAPLACALVEQTGTVSFTPGSRVALAYGVEQAVERYHCRYGVSPRYAARLETGPLRVTGRDPDGDIRVVELDDHPFYLGTLFQPERAGLTGRLSPLVVAFLRAVADGADSTALPFSHSLSS